MFRTQTDITGSQVDPYWRDYLSSNIKPACNVAVDSSKNRLTVYPRENQALGCDFRVAITKI